MAKQAEKSTSGMSLGDYLRNLRDTRRMTLREVEQASGVSNAYLSQLENGKLKRPSPHILHKLSGVFGIPYERLMEKAGYLDPKPLGGKKSRRRGRLPTFAPEDLTPGEEEELLRYLAFLRSRKG